MAPNSRRGRSNTPNHLRDVSLDTDQMMRSTVAESAAPHAYVEDAPIGISGHVAVKVSADEYLRMQEAAASAASERVEHDDADAASAHPGEAITSSTTIPQSSEDVDADDRHELEAQSSVDEALDQALERFAHTPATTSAATLSTGRVGSAAVTADPTRHRSAWPQRAGSTKTRWRRLLFAVGAVALVIAAAVAVLVSNGAPSRPLSSTAGTHRSSAHSMATNASSSIARAFEASTRVGETVADLENQRRARARAAHAQARERRHQAVERRAAMRQEATKRRAATQHSLASSSAPTTSSVSSSEPGATSESSAAPTPMPTPTTPATSPTSSSTDGSPSSGTGSSSAAGGTITKSFGVGGALGAGHAG